MEYHLISSQNNIPAFDQWIKDRKEHTACELVYLYDQLDIGLLSDEETDFNTLRNEFWQYLSQEGIVTIPPFNDLKEILDILKKAEEDEEVKIYFWLQSEGHYWMHYYWLLHWLHPVKDQLLFINGIGLPFLNENQQLIFPSSWEEIPVKEIEKALLLARGISDASMEIEGEEFKEVLKNQYQIRVISPQGKIAYINQQEAKSALLKKAEFMEYSKLSNAKKREFIRDYDPKMNRYLIELWLKEKG